MGHGVSAQESAKPEVDKASILQALAVKEEQEIRSLHQAEDKAKKQVADAERDAAERARRLEQELKSLEREILEKETLTGQKEAAEIRARSQQELEKQVKAWRQRVPAAAEKLFQRIIRTDSKK